MTMNRRVFMQLLAGAGMMSSTGALAKGLSTQAAGVRAKRPNVIFFYVDDQGRGMLSYFAKRRKDVSAIKVTTPNIDSLMERGVTFDHAHGCMYCAPARASMLTGYHDCHTILHHRITGAGILKDGSFPNSYGSNTNWVSVNKTVQAKERGADNNDIRLAPNDPYLAQVFQQAGYVTAQVSKMDYGFLVTRKQLREHGWDAYQGYLDHGRCHGFFPAFLFEHNFSEGSAEGRILPIDGNTRKDSGQSPENETYTNRMARWNYAGKQVWAPDVTVDWVKRFVGNERDKDGQLMRDADKPFFLFYTTHLPHGPTAIPPSKLKYTGHAAGVDHYWPAIHPDIWKPTLNGTPIDLRDPKLEGKSATNLGDAPDSRNKAIDFWNNADGARKNNGNPWDPLKNELTYLEMEYASMVKYFDDHVGEVIAKTKEMGIYENTVFMFSSDNGHELYIKQTDGGRNYKDSGPYGGTGLSEQTRDIFDGNNGQYDLKWNNWEGGINVPLTFCWPKGFPTRTVQTVSANYDILTTFADWFGVDASLKDGTSLLPVLTGEVEDLPPDRWIVAAGSGGPCLIRNDGWKLRSNGDGSSCQLYNLNTDYTERTNLASRYPKRVAQMKETLALACDAYIQNGNGTKTGGGREEGRFSVWVGDATEGGN